MSLAARGRLAGRFEVVRQLGEGGMGVVYEAVDHERNTRVALKTLPGLHPSGLYRFKHEFRALAEITHPHLVSLHELVAEGDTWFFTMELVDDAVDFLEWVRPAAESVDAELSGVRTRGAAAAGDATAVQLSAPSRVIDADRPTQSTRGRAPELARLRNAFVQLIDGVSAIHTAGKLHRDLKPGNVLVRADGRVVILDFGLIAELSRPEAPVPSLPSGAARSLVTTDQGMSGTAAYMAPEQALGAPLDVSADAYAIGAMLFHALTGSLPFMGSVNDVLFRKQVEDAPRASDVADGVPDDVDALAAALLSRDRAERPSLADARRVLTHEVAPEVDDAPTADDVLVGRDAPARELDDALALARSGRTVVRRVSGPSGVGKTALLDAFLAAARASSTGVTVLQGRCLERESVPFKALDGVVDALTHALLLLPDEARAALIPRDLPALARLFPVLGRVVPPDVTGTVDVALLRAKACGGLADVIAALGERAVVVVQIDDLQWSDVDGAELLGELIGELGARHARVLLTLGYRSEYERRSAGLTALAAALARHRGAVSEEAISVGPLPADDARALARRLLGDAGAEEEAAWIATASDGLPWFVHELARALRAGIVSAGDSTTGVMERRASSLPADARDVLALVAVAGRPIRLRHVKEAVERHSIPEELLRPLRAGSWVRSTGPRLDDLVETFHDRVREGITASLGPARRRELHAALARVLDGDAPLEVVAEHHEAAGHRRDAALGYERAADEAKSVLALARAERLYVRAESLHETDDGRARVTAKRIHHLTDTARFADAYALGRKAVAGYGVDLPEAASPPRLLAGLGRVLWGMRGHTPVSLLALPSMTDTRAKTAMSLLGATMKAAYQVRPELCVIVANESVDLCLKHGNSPDAALGYMVHGAIFRGGVIGRHRTGHAFGRLARELVERFDNDEQRAEVSFVVGYFGTSWMEPATVAEALWERAFDAGLRTGDLFHTGCAASGTMASLLMRGAPLAEIVDRADRYLDTLEPRGLDEAVATVRGVRRVAYALSTGDALDGGGFDVTAHEARLRAFGSAHFAHVWYVARAMALIAQGSPAAALDVLRSAGQLHASTRGMLHGVEHDYLEAIAIAATARSGGAPQRAWAAARVAATAARWRVLASDCDANFGAKAALLAAEARCLLQGRDAAASSARRAIELARRHAMPHVEALAHRLLSDVDAERAAWARWGVGAQRG